MSLSSPLRKVRYVILGSTGVGKSKLGNRLLGQNCFDVSETYDPVTQQPLTMSVQNNDVIIIITDTAGFNDPNRDSNETVMNLAQMLQEDENGPINRFILVQNGTQRFSADMADNITMLLHSFHDEHPCISIVLTHVDGSSQRGAMKKQAYQNSLLNHFRNSNIYEQISRIEIFLIDNNDENPSPIPPELDPMNPNQPDPIDPHMFRPQGFEGRIEREEERRFIEQGVEGDVLHGTQIDRWRWKTIPFTGKGVHYSEWHDNVPPAQIDIPLRYIKSLIRRENVVDGDQHITSNGSFDPNVQYTEYENITETEEIYEMKTIVQDFKDECVDNQHINFERTENGYRKTSRQVISDWIEVPVSQKSSYEYYECKDRLTRNLVDIRGIFYKTYTFETKIWKERRLVKIVDGHEPEVGEWEIVSGSEITSIDRTHDPFPYGLLFWPAPFQMKIHLNGTHMVEGDSTFHLKVSIR